MAGISTVIREERKKERGYFRLNDSSWMFSVNIDQEEWVSLLSQPACHYFKSSLFADSQVIQVRARDRDADGDPDNPAGKIVYSIVSTHKHFKIHPETGWLSTNKVSLEFITYNGLCSRSLLLV